MRIHGYIFIYIRARQFGRDQFGAIDEENWFSQAIRRLAARAASNNCHLVAILTLLNKLTWHEELSDPVEVSSEASEALDSSCKLAPLFAAKPAVLS